MKQISRDEFEKCIQSIIDGETTRRKLAKDLETDMRTINNKITELAETSPVLYQKFIDKFPYRPKTIKVDIEDLAIKVITNGLQTTSKSTGISTRTIARKVKTLEKTNPELYLMYKQRNDRMSFEERMAFQDKAKCLQKDSKVTRTELQEKEEQIKKFLAEFEQLVKSGLSKAEAGRRLNSDYPTIWKKYQELKRIEEQKKYIKEEKQSKNFRSQIKVTNIKPSSVNEENIISNVGEEGREERG